jgi:hypothetical protein
MTLIYGLAATTMNGIVAGSLLFAGLVDTRTLDTMSKNHQAKNVFSVWWPYGAQYMIPLMATSTVVNLGAFVAIRNPMWLVSTATQVGILAFTRTCMWKGIQALMLDFDAETLKKFTRMHFIRILISTFGIASAWIAILQ